VGPSGSDLRAKLSPMPVRDAGPLPADEVSIHLSAMDLHLTPFIDGASTRRGSFLAGLQHGVPSVSTRGPLTDPLIAEADGDAYLLTPVGDATAYVRAVQKLYRNPSSRSLIATRSSKFFDSYFSWPTIADRVLSTLRRHYQGSASNQE